MNKSILMLVIVVSIIMLYQFVIKPIQTDKKLQECLSIPTQNATGTPEQIKDFEDYCFKKYGKN